ncbi:MAG: ExbD/TolR family protein [Planctomycetota bacterium]
MRVPQTVSGRSAFRFNITPMIDVVFLLIIFFLVASYFLRSEQSRTIQLPNAAGGQDDPGGALTHLTITVEADGHWSVAGQPLTRPQVEARIQELANAAVASGSTAQLRIRADRAAAYREIRQLIEICAAHQLRGIQFAVSGQTAVSEPPVAR